jgi:hypothetical protein
MTSANEINFPTIEEVNELIESAEAAFGFNYCYDNCDEYRSLLFAATGCKAQAQAFDALQQLLATR